MTLRALLIALLLFAPLATHAESQPSWLTPSEWLARTFQDRDPAAVAIVKAHPHLAAAATRYFHVCTADMRAGVWGNCSLNHYDFVLDYIRAFYGYPGSEADLALILSGSGPLIPPGSYLEAGVRQAPVEGCAWGIVLGPSAGPPPMTPEIACAGLQRYSLMQKWAADRAKKIEADIAAHLARGNKPPDVFPPFQSRPRAAWGSPALSRHQCLGRHGISVIRHASGTTAVAAA